jgi:hypothetical protein
MIFVFLNVIHRDKVTIFGRVEGDADFSAFQAASYAPTVAFQKKTPWQ